MKLLEYSINHTLKGKSDLNASASANGWCTVKSTLEELLNEVTVEGKAINPGILSENHRNSKNTIGYDLLVVDVDNADGNQLTYQQALEHPFIKANACAIWTSSSHLSVTKSNPNGDLHKFRVGFLLKEPLRFKHDDEQEVEKCRLILRHLWNNIPGFDKSCDIYSFLFGHPGSDYKIINPDNVIDVDQLDLTVPVRTFVADPNYTNDITTDQSVANLKSMLDHIDSSDTENWKTVIGAVANITEDVGGTEVALDLLLDWCSKDYPQFLEDPTHERQTTRMFHEWVGTGVGGWNKLKALASDGGREGTYNPDFMDPLELISDGDGFDISTHEPLPVISGDGIHHHKPQVNTLVEGSDGKLYCFDEKGKAHFIDYAKDTQLMAKHILMTVSAVCNESKFRFNEVTKRIERNGFAYKEEQLKQLPLELSKEYGINFPLNLHEAVMTIAGQNKYDPYIEELLEIEKTVQPIDISNIASRYFKCTDPLHDVMMEKWLVGLVGRLLNPGLQLRQVLVVVGEQYIGKDAFIGILTKDRVADIHCGSDLNSKETLTTANAAWVANLAEIESVTKGQVLGKLKGWITKSYDGYVQKYARDTENYPRRFSIYGSCNTSSNQKFLSDTQNTRYWVIESPIPTGEQIDLDLLGKERDAILAGAIQLYRKYQSGEYEIKLTNEQLKQSEANNQGYIEEAEYTMDFVNEFSGRDVIVLGEAYDAVGIFNRANKAATNEIKRSLEQAEFEQVKSPRKLRSKSKDKPEISIKPWIRKGTTPTSDQMLQELTAYFEKPGQKWSKFEF